MFSVHLGDIAIGLCPCPPSAMCIMTGVVSTGMPTSFEMGSPRSKIGDTVVFPCGTSIITTGSVSELLIGMPSAMVGSVVSGAANGVITTGVPWHIVV